MDIKITSNNKIVNEICNFLAYVDSFYNEKTGIYPIKGMTNSMVIEAVQKHIGICLLYTSPSPRDLYRSRMPSSA